jgi:hypothetical protein
VICWPIVAVHPESNTVQAQSQSALSDSRSDSTVREPKLLDIVRSLLGAEQEQSTSSPANITSSSSPPRCSTRSRSAVLSTWTSTLQELAAAVASSPVQQGESAAADDAHGTVACAAKIDMVHSVVMAVLQRRRRRQCREGDSVNNSTLVPRTLLTPAVTPSSSVGDSVHRHTAYVLYSHVAAASGSAHANEAEASPPMHFTRQSNSQPTALHGARPAMTQASFHDRSTPGTGTTPRAQDNLVPQAAMQRDREYDADLS